MLSIQKTLVPLTEEDRRILRRASRFTGILTVVFAFSLLAIPGLLFEYGRFNWGGIFPSFLCLLPPCIPLFFFYQYRRDLQENQKLVMRGYLVQKRMDLSGKGVRVYYRIGSEEWLLEALHPGDSSQITEGDLIEIHYVFRSGRMLYVKKIK
jgi:hypothetical protein